MAKDTGHTMTRTPVQFMIADIDRKIGNLTELRKNLQQFEIDFPHTAASLVPIARRANGAKVRGPYKTRKTAARRNERTNERTNARRTPAARSLPNGAGDRQGEILAAMRAHGGSMKPSELMTAVGAASLASLRHWMKPLMATNAIVATGTTASRRFSLPGRVPKEAL